MQDPCLTGSNNIPSANNNYTIISRQKTGKNQASSRSLSSLDIPVSKLLDTLHLYSSTLPGIQWTCI